jgi:predicted transcriptional regulator YheO
MKYNPLLEPYKMLVPFLAEVLGNSCEILLHDISQPKHSVIAIANGFQTGRKVGSPFTDLAMKIMREKQYVDKDYLANYNGRSKGKNFVSSTFFIKHDGKLIGLLCVNRNMDTINNLDAVLEAVKKNYNLLDVNEEVEETMDTPVGDILPKMVSEEIKAVGVQPERMTTEERAAVIHRLMNAGIHNMKGAVVEIAKQLHLSEPTVYRYIKKEKIEK